MWFEVIAYNGGGWERVVAIFCERGNAELEARLLERAEEGHIGYYVRRAGSWELCLKP